MDLDETRNGLKRFCARSFVKNLIEIGDGISCDCTNDEFNRRLELPAYFDGNKFKRGQQFFHKHIWAMFFSKIMGLVTILSIPDIAQILRFTQMSDTPMSAYKRYLKTIFHMYIWYNEDCCAESKTWKSIEKVRFKHNSASERHRNARKKYITQHTMALTQFGFMGFAVWRTELVGIHNAQTYELEGLIHFWKVIGHLMGIEDRFNICRDSVDETKEICNELVLQIFKPEMLKKHPDFLSLSHSLLTGMWCMMPFFQYKSFVQLAADTITDSTSTLKIPTTYNSNNNNSNIGCVKRSIDYVDLELNIFEKIYLKMIILFMWTLKFTVIRVFHQYVIYITLWLMEHFPFLAYYSFGKANSHVRALD